MHLLVSVSCVGVDVSVMVRRNEVGAITPTPALCRLFGGRGRSSLFPDTLWRDVSQEESEVVRWKKKDK